MIESLLHLVGLCPDHFNHINVIDIALMISTFGLYPYIKNKLKINSQQKKKVSYEDIKQVRENLQKRMEHLPKAND